MRTGCNILTLNPETKKALSQPNFSELPWATRQRFIFGLKTGPKMNPKGLPVACTSFLRVKAPSPVCGKNFWLIWGEFCFQSYIRFNSALQLKVRNSIPFRR